MSDESRQAAIQRQAALFALLLFCSIFGFSWGWFRAQSAQGIMIDYRVVYIGARCLIRHCDLYNEAAVMQAYFAEGGKPLPAPKPGEIQQYLVAQQLYPPTAELFFAPFALLAWPTSYGLWVATTVALITMAAFLMCTAAQQFATGPPFYLACFVLVNSGILFAGGNPAGVAVALCIIGTLSILQNRAPALGVLCLAISILIKPHDGGFIWLYLLLLGGNYQKRAIQTFVVAGTVAIPALVWISSVSPDWIGEIRSNLVRYSSGGATNDPAGGTATMMLNLQPLLATYWNSPKFYNFLTYALLAPLFLLLLLAIRRGLQLSRDGIWIGLAAIATLSLLPVYHRPHDAKILLLTLPACAALWAQKGWDGWLGLALTTAGIVITSDLPLAAIEVARASIHLTPNKALRILDPLIGHPIGIVLLVVAMFYVLVLWNQTRTSTLYKCGE